MTMRSIRHRIVRRVQRASCLRPKAASNSFGTKFTVYRIFRRAQRASLFRPKRVPNIVFCFLLGCITVFCVRDRYGERSDHLKHGPGTHLPFGVLKSQQLPIPDSSYTLFLVPVF